MSRSRPPKGLGRGRQQGGRDYEVGYGRPPVATRFRTGGVGNPKGRPKKKKTVAEILEAVMTTRVKFEENGRAKILTGQEFILHNLLRLAARDIRAINLLFTLKHRYEGSSETTLSLEELDQEDRKIIDEYMAMLSANTTPTIPSDNEANDATDQEIDDTTIGKPDGSDGDAT
jgi:Family of unknown function (DUF5681)